MTKEMLPYDLDSEESTIGSLLIDSESIIEIDNIISADDFFSEQNQLIYSACHNIYSRGSAINQVTVAEELIHMGKIDDIGGIGYLSHLISIVPTSLHIKYYALIVKKCSINRRIISFGGQAASIGYKNDDDIKGTIEKLQQILNKLTASIDTDTLISPNQLASLGMNRYAKLEKGMGQSVLTGFNELDLETGGAFAGELWIFGGRAGIGKTSALLQIVENIGKQGNILLASLEMNWGAILDRMIASRLGVHPRSLRVGHYSEGFMKQIVDTVPQIAETNIYLFGKGLSLEGGITTDTLLREATKLKKSIGLSAIAIDYLGLFADEGKNLYEKTSAISGKLKRIAETLEVPIICAAQLSRVNEQMQGKKQIEHRPTLTSLRDSGSIEQDADVVLFLYRDDYYREIREEHPECNGIAELILAKQRQGESNITFILRWNSERRCYE
ncbi:MAG: DnaB-like helicase C-terminal domain-containing protein [Patescibacteria group bacterium]|jgi:replicative DNA helicase